MNPSDNISTHYRTCNLCEAMCGLEIRHQGDQIMSIRGDKADPFSRGSICPKATALQDLHDDPDRLKYPVRRTLDGWKEMSWNEALELVADKIKATQQQHGKDAVGLYLGNPTVHNHGAMIMLPLLLASLDTKSQFSATSADQLPHMLASLEMFGNQYLMPIPDLDHTQTFVCIGGNPLVSNGSIMTVPDVTARLKDIQKKGGKIIVVDPRRTETAELADQHIAINPASDPFFLLGILNVIFKQGWETLGTTEGFVDGLDIVKDIALRFTPEKVSDIIGISPDIITTLARDICESDSAIIYGRFGVCTQEYGGLNAWLLYVLNIVTGNLDTRGGVMFTRPAIDVAGLTGLADEGGSFNTHQTRVSKLPEFGGQLPVVTMAEEILTEGKGQIKTMITHAGNPVLSTPDGKQLEKALESLDFMVSIDFYINETTQYANVILPPTGPLEHDHYDMAFHIFAIRNTTKYSPALFKAGKGTKHDWEILLGLCTRIDSKNRRSSLTSAVRQQVLQRIGSEGLLDLALRFGPYGQPLPVVDKLNEFFEDLFMVGKPYSRIRNTAIKTLRDIKLIDDLIRVSPYGISFNPIRSGLSLSKLKEAPHGIDIGPLEPCLPDRLAHKNKRIKLAPEIFIKDIQ
ncbi:MAG: molybdopterin-dependent oxidoreductase [Pseudomonadales bacterium]|nr:molybdopterin-dependent oxidoreductase [Pseudomonadales bacterium]